MLQESTRPRMKKLPEQLAKGRCERKEEKTVKVSEKNDEERCGKRKREEEKEENNTERVRRRCDGLVGQIWRVVVVFLRRTT